MDRWMYNAWIFQQQKYQQLGNRKWDELNGNKDYLLDKLTVAYEICFGDNCNENEGIKKMTDRVNTEALKLFEQKNYNQRFACTFVNFKLLENDKEGKLICVFWLQSENGSVRCLDLSGRNYESWSDFIENNSLPKCYIIAPRYGKYYHESNVGEGFIDIEFLESVACSTKRVVKEVFDVVSTVVGAAAGGVLVFNPVGGTVIIGAGVATVLTGAYSAGKCCNRLVDISNHDGGLSLKESKTLLAVGSLVITVVGTAALGGAAGIKGIAAKTGTILSKGSMAYKLANNVSIIARVFSGATAGINVLIVIDNYKKQGCLTKQDVIRLAKIIFFTFNAVVPVNLLEEFIISMASYSAKEFVRFCMGSPSRSYEYVNNVCVYLTGDDLPKLMDLIFPDFKNYTEKISFVKPVINRADIIVARTLHTIKTNKFDIEYIYFLMDQLEILCREITNVKNKNQAEIRRRFDKQTSEIINRWTRHDGIDLYENNSEFEKKINTPIEIKEKIAETSVLCSKNPESHHVLEKRKKHMFTKFLKLVDFHGLKDSLYVINKMNFYCDIFKSLHSKLMQIYHYQHFLYTINKGSECRKNFFLSEFEVDDIYEHVYNKSFEMLEENLQTLHEDFESDFVCNSPVNQQNERLVFEFEMPCSVPGLTKNDFYDKAKELVPKLETSLNDGSTTFDDYGGLAIIKSKQDDFTLFFYTVVEESYLKGILLFVEGFCA